MTGTADDRFAARRESFLRELGDGVAVLPAAKTLIRGRDTELRFRQDADFYYLTGFDEPDAVAVLTPHDAERRFTLFLRPRDPDREVWDGARHGVDGARERFGADAAYPLEELGEHLGKLVEPADRILYALGADAELDRAITGLVLGYRRSRQRSGRGPLVLEDPGLILGEMRVVKDPAEIEKIRTAARLSAAGHGAAMAATRPEGAESELEAVVDSTFRRAGALPAFPSIVASGPNATTLHYVTNNRRYGRDDLVLIDAGAEWEMYCADISRTYPASGRFSTPQREVYDIVCAALDAAVDAAVPGAPASAMHDAAVGVLTRGMLEIGLLRGDVDELIEEGAHKRFFMHQTSHWLGLDVHDVGLYKRAGKPVELKPGMVLTLEPGLYVAADADDVPDALRGIGVRIEDNLLITAEGHEVLTRDVPVDPDAIAELVGRG